MQKRKGNILSGLADIWKDTKKL